MSEILYPLTLKSSVSVLKYIVKLQQFHVDSIEIKTNAVNIALLADEMKLTHFSSSPL